VINRVTLNNDVVINTNENIPEVKIHNFSVGMPIPYMLFTKGFAETMKMNESRYHELFYTCIQAINTANSNVDTNGFGCLTSCRK
jgi:hypothetical protein